MELTVKQALEKGIIAHRKGNLTEAANIYRSILNVFPKHPDANHNLGLIAVSSNKTEVALPLFKTALELNPKMEQYWLSYINALINEKKFEEADQFIKKAEKNNISSDKLGSLIKRVSSFSSKKSINKKSPSKKKIRILSEHYDNKRYDNAEKMALSIIEKFPENPYSWKILGSLRSQTGRYYEAIEANEKAVKLSPRDSECHNTLGVTLTGLGRRKEAIASFNKAISLDPKNIMVYNNLGIALKDEDRIEEAIRIYKHGITLKPDFVLAHYNLGIIYQALNKIEDAEECYRKAIKLKPDFAEAYSYLGCIMYDKGDESSALDCFRKSLSFKPDLIISKVRLNIVNSRKSRGQLLEKTNVNELYKYNETRLDSNPLILNRDVENDLIEYLHSVKSRSLEDTKDARFGSGKCSADFELFKDKNKIIKNLSLDLKSIISEAVKSNVFIHESFFNIYETGGGIKSHSHVVLHDMPMNIWKEKYSLVYYLSVGDQKCMDPGILKFDKPDENILPSDGMIVMFPANKNHYAFYSGKSDRVIIGVNFYAI
jgi:tetratricopeptide (TPR) repeat protein